MEESFNSKYGYKKQITVCDTIYFKLHQLFVLENIEKKNKHQLPFGKKKHGCADLWKTQQLILPTEFQYSSVNVG